MTTTTSRLAAIADSHLGGHVAQQTLGLPIVLEIIPLGGTDRGDFDANDISRDTMDGQWLGVAPATTGSSCDVQAMAATAP